MMDLKIKNEREEFHCRSCGVIKQNNKFLIMRVNRSEYYHIPGGHIELGETSKDAVIREIKEEVGCIARKVTLFATQENFWVRNKRQCHGIEFNYIVEPNSIFDQSNREFIENDKGEEKLVEIRWVTVDELKEVDLKPANIKELLLSGKYLDGLVHLVKDKHEMGNS